MNAAERYYLSGQTDEVQKLFYQLEHPRLGESPEHWLMKYSEAITKKAKDGDRLFFNLLGRLMPP